MHAVIEREQRGRVSADSVEPRLGQRNQPRVPGYQVQRHPNDRVDGDEDEYVKQIFQMISQMALIQRRSQITQISQMESI